jgi:hypothetical protein
LQISTVLLCSCFACNSSTLVQEHKSICSLHTKLLVSSTHSMRQPVDF